MNYTEIYNGMVGRNFITAFNENFRKTDQTFLSILATLIYKVKSTDIKEFKVIDGVVSYTLEDEPEEGEEDNRTWIPVDITAWGNITGNILDQTDLANALDSKAAADTVATIDNILSTLRQEFNTLKSNYEDTEVTVGVNTDDIADLKEENNTKVNSEDIKAIRVQANKFQWTTDGITWNEMETTTSISWGNLTGDINLQTDLMALFNNISDNVTALSNSFTTLSNSVATLTTDVDNLSDTVSDFDTRLTNDEAEYAGRFNSISNSLTDLDTAIDGVDDRIDGVDDRIDGVDQSISDLADEDTRIEGKIDLHIADDNNPHNVNKSQIGLGNVDNTADIDKPLSTAQKTYVDTEIANNQPDLSSYVEKSGDTSKVFVGTDFDYEQAGDKTGMLAFVLYNDWRSRVLSNYTLYLYNPTFYPWGIGDINLKNCGEGRYDGKEFTSTFTSSGSDRGKAFLQNIPEGKYAFNFFVTGPYEDNAKSYIVGDGKYVSINIEENQNNYLDLYNALLEPDYEYLDKLVIWVEDGITVTSVEMNDDSGRYLTEVLPRLTEIPETGYTFMVLSDQTQSSDPDYVNGVKLGGYDINYSYVDNGSTVTNTKTINVTKNNIYDVVIVKKGGNS